MSSVNEYKGKVEMFGDKQNVRERVRRLNFRALKTGVVYGLDYKLYCPTQGDKTEKTKITVKMAERYLGIKEISWEDINMN